MSIIDPSEEPGSPGQLSVSPSAVGACLVVAVAGEADMATADQLRDGLRKAIGSNPKSLILDVSGLAFCSLHGLDALHDAIELAEQAGIHVTMHGMTQQLTWLHRTYPKYRHPAGQQDRHPTGTSPPRSPSGVGRDVPLARASVGQSCD